LTVIVNEVRLIYETEVEKVITFVAELVVNPTTLNSIFGILIKYSLRFTVNCFVYAVLKIKLGSLEIL